MIIGSGKWDTIKNEGKISMKKKVERELVWNVDIDVDIVGCSDVTSLINHEA